MSTTQHVPCPSQQYVRPPRAVRRAAVAVVAAAAAVSLVFPAIAEAKPGRQVRELTMSGIVTDGTDRANRVGPRDDGTVMVVTPGTDDGNLGERIKRTVGQRQTLIVAYPESLWPFVGGKSSPVPPLADTYDTSKRIAINRNLAVMRKLAGAGMQVIYTGYSQGADALGNATEKAVAQGIDLSDSKIVLAADVRGPWGIKAAAETIPGAPAVVKRFGITPDGARDPERSSGADVTSTIIVGDPASNFQWQPRRPLESILVNGAGFITIHTGWGAQTYGNLDALGSPTELRSVDGTTRYQVYDARHPLALLRQMVHDRTGLPYTRADLKRWDAEGERFFATEAPSVRNSAVPVTEVSAPPHEQKQVVQKRTKAARTTKR
ncbi:MAG: PE-PPE domain-containing protein, partial [Gordonia amarae]